MHPRVETPADFLSTKMENFLMNISPKLTTLNGKDSFKYDIITLLFQCFLRIVSD